MSETRECDCGRCLACVDKRIAADRAEAFELKKRECEAMAREQAAELASMVAERERARAAQAIIEVPVQVVAKLYFDDDGAWSHGEFLFNGGGCTVRVRHYDGERGLTAHTPGAALDLALQLAAQKRLRGDSR